MELDSIGEKLENLVEMARSNGAADAKIIDTDQIVIDKRVRLKCAVPLCSSYDNHLLCPPNLMSIEEFKEIVGLYKKAIIIQIEADSDSLDKSDKPLNKELCDRLEDETRCVDFQNRLHRLVNMIESTAFKLGFYFAAGLIGGECVLCEECVSWRHRGECRHPFEARPSMEAMGIDVFETCKRAGLWLRLSSSEKVRWTGLILIY